MVQERSIYSRHSSKTSFLLGRSFKKQKLEGSTRSQSRKIWDYPSIDDDNEVDVVHDSTSSNFVLIMELGELEIMHLDWPGHTSIIRETSRSVPNVDDDFINDDDDDKISEDDKESIDDDVGIDIDEK